MATTGRMSSPRKTRVLYILDGFPDPQAGTEGQFWLLLRSLDRARFDPAILLLRPSDFLAAHAGDVPIEVLHVDRLRSLRALRRVAGAAIRARLAGTDIAHLFFNDVSLLFPILLRPLGIPTIVSRRDLGFWHTPGVLRVLRANAPFATAVIANCEAVREAVIQAEGFRPSKVHVIYNGVTRSPPPPRPEMPLELPTRCRLLVAVANLRPLKRMADAIRALALVSRQIEDVHLLIVGEDRPGIEQSSHRAELEGLAHESGVADRVHFAGKILDPMPLISAAEVCLLCSQTEGLSNVLVEYMFGGRPTVCTDVGGSRELIQDGETGYVVPVGAVEPMAERLVQLLSDPQRARRFGAAALERVNELFAPHVMVDRHEQLYTKLTQGHRGGGVLARTQGEAH